MERKLSHIFNVAAVSVMFGNIAMLKLLAGVTSVLVKTGFLGDGMKTLLIRQAVESDSPEVVELVMSILNRVPVDKETIEVAHSRGNRKIIEIVDPNFERTDRVTEKLKVKDMIIQKLENGESSLDLVPINKDFE